MLFLSFNDSMVHTNENAYCTGSNYRDSLALPNKQNIDNEKKHYFFVSQNRAKMWIIIERYTQQSKQHFSMKNKQAHFEP